MRRHAPAVGRFLYSSGAAPDEIDDLVQEALFRTFRRLEGWRGEASFRSWLFAIAGNVLRDEFRRRKGRQVLSLEDRDLPDNTDPQAHLAATEMEEGLRQLRVGKGADQDSVTRLTRELLDLRVEYAESWREEMGKLSFLTPVQRARLMVTRDRLLRRVHEMREERRGFRHRGDGD